LNKIQYKEFPQKVRNFIESYFSNQLQKVSNQLPLLHISFEERPQNYPSFINAEFIPPFKIAYYTDNLQWNGIIHDTTHFFQYHRDTNEYKKNSDIVKTAILTNFEYYKNNPFEKEAFKVQEAYNNYNFQKLSWATRHLLEEDPERLKNTIWVRSVSKYGTTVPEYWYIQSVNNNWSINGLFNLDLNRLKIEVLYHDRMMTYHLNIPFANEEFGFVQDWDPSQVRLSNINKLSWQDPESLVGWLVKFEYTEFFKPSFGVVLEETDNEVGARWFSSPQTAIDGWHYLTRRRGNFNGYPNYSYESKQRAIPVLQITHNKLSWQQPPEDLTGWMVKVLINSDNETVDNNTAYGIIIHDYSDKVAIRWRSTEERAKEAYKDYYYSPYSLSQSLYKKNINIIPLYKVDLNKQASDNFDFYKDQNSQMYRKRLNYYNEDKGAEIFWSSRDAQEKRFEALLDIGDLTDKEILDVGAGYCDLLDYLEKRNIKIKKYVGIDIVPEIVKKARELHPNTNIEVRDIQKDPIEENSFDYVFGSGIFALQSNDWNNYVVDMLRKMLLASKIGVGVNFLKQQEMSRLSWQQPPEDLTGWMVKGIGNLYKHFIYGVVVYEKIDIIYTIWKGTEKEAITAFYRAIREGYAYEVSTPVYKKDIIPLYEVGLDKQASLTQLKYSNPQEIVNLIKQNVTDKVILKNNYLADDFSIFLMK